jgi:hypothetical protein
VTEDEFVNEGLGSVRHVKAVSTDIRGATVDENNGDREHQDDNNRDGEGRTEGAHVEGRQGPAAGAGDLAGRDAAHDGAGEALGRASGLAAGAHGAADEIEGRRFLATGGASLEVLVHGKARVGRPIGSPRLAKDTSDLSAV